MGDRLGTPGAVGFFQASQVTYHFANYFVLFKGRYIEIGFSKIQEPTQLDFAVGVVNNRSM